MKILLAVLLFLQAPAQTQTKQAPQQGPPPKNLTQRADGHFTANLEPANAGKFEVHVVKQGETLSQIAGEVLKNPRLWPQLWEQNEHIVNPHWIYPNDKILVRPVTQITEAVPAPEPAPPPPPEPAPPPPAPASAPQPAPPPAPAPVSRPALFALGKPFNAPEVKPSDLYCSGFVRTSPVPKDLKVIGKYDATGSVMASETEYVYLSKGSEDGITAGSVYQVIRPTTTVMNPKGRTSKDRNLGMHYLDIAQLSVVLTQPDFSLARVMRSCEAVEVGDIMMPFQQIQLPPIPAPRRFSPTMKASGDVKGSVVIAKSVLMNFGSTLKGTSMIPGVRGGHLGSLERGVASEGNIVYLDIGQDSGVKPGDIFIVYRATQLDDKLYDLPKESKKIQGLKNAIGELIVLKVGERASTALVTYASDGISLGDSVERR